MLRGIYATNPVCCSKHSLEKYLVVWKRAGMTRGRVFDLVKQSTKSSSVGYFSVLLPTIIPITWRYIPLNNILRIKPFELLINTMLCSSVFCVTDTILVLMQVLPNLFIYYECQLGIYHEAKSLEIKLRHLFDAPGNRKSVNTNAKCSTSIDWGSLHINSYMSRFIQRYF